MPSVTNRLSLGNSHLLFYLDFGLELQGGYSLSEFWVNVLVMTAIINIVASMGIIMRNLKLLSLGFT